MANKLHKDLTGCDIHVPYAFEYADPTARLAATGFDASDVGKLARQLDNDTLWMLTSTAPTWVSIGDPHDPETVYYKGLTCTAGEAVGDWVVVTAADTVAKVTDNSSSHVIGVIYVKPTTTTCDLITFGKAALFSGLDPTQKRYFLSASGGLTSTVPATGWVIELGKSLNATTLNIDIKTPLRRA